MKSVLLIAGVYSIVLGMLMICFPYQSYAVTGLAPPNPMQLWQCFGMMIGVFGLGFLISAYNPYRYWPLVLMGLIAKIMGSIGFLLYAFEGSLNWSLGSMILLDDVIWLIPFALILRGVYRHHFEQDKMMIDMLSESYPLDFFETAQGNNLQELTQQQPTLMVFLRHFGCTFCREALKDLAAQRNQIESNGSQICLVHMSNHTVAAEELKKYNLQDIQSISDPEQMLYKKFTLKRGNLFQLMGFKIWARALSENLIFKHGIGKQKGDAMQMPGVFLIHNGEVIKQYIHKSSSDRPSYTQLSKCANCNSQTVIETVKISA